MYHCGCLCGIGHIRNESQSFAKMVLHPDSYESMATEIDWEAHDENT